MTDEHIEKLIHKNQNLLFVLGWGMSLILECADRLPQEKEKGLDWFIEAVENLVYHDKPLPKMP